MRRTILDLGVVLTTCGLVTGQLFTPASTPPPKIVPSQAASQPDYWKSENHRPGCAGRKVARIEELRTDWVQQTLIERGLVVYVAGYLGCSPTPPNDEVDRGRAIWLCGNGFVDNPVPGRSWYCKRCGSRWGGMESFLDHP